VAAQQALNCLGIPLQPRPSSLQAVEHASSSCGLVEGHPPPDLGKPRLLRRGEDGPGGTGTGLDAGAERMSPARTLQERQETYLRAREELGLGREGGRGGGRGGPAGRGSGPGRSGMSGPATGGGRKAVYRDKGRELNDPDYVRGMGRCGRVGGGCRCSGLPRVW
jgi:hypothetical protein